MKLRDHPLLFRLHGQLPWVWVWRRIKAYRFGRMCHWGRRESLRWALIKDPVRK